MRVPDDTGDEQSGVEQEELRIFALLTLDCLALSQALLQRAAPVEDQLELVRRRRLIQQIEAALDDGWPHLGTTDTG